MALLFSKVTVTAGNDATSFLVGGIPREYDDLEDWDAVDDFLISLNIYTFGRWSWILQAESFVKIHLQM